ncbi:MAG: hypothetical protein IKN54_08395 [Lachnospiraceae bacterium]|nr:hypothetical protein [Lachnospiraceae bacterium]
MSSITKPDSPGGNGIIHIIQRRNEKEGLSPEEIASLLYIIKNYSETEIPSGYDDTNTRAFINKNGIRIILQKNWREDNRNWLVTGYGIIDSNTKKLSLEATETIKTVNAQYGYKPEHSRLREQVGAVIASISSIRQQQEKVKVLKSRTKIEKGIKTISTANPKTVYDRAVLKTNPKNSSDKDLITAYTAINFAINSLENKNKSDLFKHTKAKKLIEKAANKKLLSAVEKELLSRGYTFEAHNSVNETSTNYQRVVIMDISNGKERQVSLKNTREPQSDSQVLENPMTEHSSSSKTNIIHETVSDNNNTKNIHNSTWQWVHYDDASGSIRSPEGESYFSYDWTTKEYKENNGSIWEMFEGAPDENTDFEAFQKYAEDCIRKYIAKDPSIVFTNKYVDRDFSYNIASGLSNKITPDLFDEITQVVYDMGYDCKCSFTRDADNRITDINFKLYDENVNCESLSFVDLINKIIENDGKEITQLHQGVDDKEIDKLNNFVKSLEEIKKSFSNEKPLWDEVVNIFISFGFPINKYNKDDFFTMLSYNMETSSYYFIKKDNKIYIHDNSDSLEDNLFTEEKITAFFENCVDSLRNKNDKNLNWQINMIENLLLDHVINRDYTKVYTEDLKKYLNKYPKLTDEQLGIMIFDYDLADVPLVKDKNGAIYQKDNTSYELTLLTPSNIISQSYWSTKNWIDFIYDAKKSDISELDKETLKERKSLLNKLENCLKHEKNFHYVTRSITFPCEFVFPKEVSVNDKGGGKKENYRWEIFNELKEKYGFNENAAQTSYYEANEPENDSFNISFTIPVPLNVSFPKEKTDEWINSVEKELKENYNCAYLNWQGNERVEEIFENREKAVSFLTELYDAEFSDIKFNICDKDEYRLDDDTFWVPMFANPGFKLEKLLDPEFDLTNDAIKFYYTQKENQKDHFDVYWLNVVSAAHPEEQNEGLISTSDLPDNIKETIINNCRLQAEIFCKEKFGCDIENIFINNKTERLAASIESQIDDSYNSDAEHKERYYLDFDSGLLNLPDSIEGKKIKNYRIGIVFNHENNVNDYFIDAITENGDIFYDIHTESYVIDEKYKMIFNAAENKIAFNVLKEKYQIIYQEALLKCKKEAETELKNEYGNSSFSDSEIDERKHEIFHDTANTEEVVGYYMTYYSDTYLSQWKENINGKELTEQDKKVSDILQNLYEKERCFMTKQKIYKKVESINDLCTEKTFLAYPQLSLALQEQIIFDFNFAQIPLYKDQEGNIYQREMNKDLLEGDETDYMQLTPEGIIDQAYWMNKDWLSTFENSNSPENSETSKLDKKAISERSLMLKELEEIRLFETDPKTYFKNVFKRALQIEFKQIKKEIKAGKIKPVKDKELLILAEERLGSNASPEEIVGWYITEHENDYLENFKSSGNYGSYNEQVLRLMEKTKQIEDKNNVMKYELLDIGKYFNSHLPEGTEIFNEEEINNLKIYTQELSGDVLLYDKINDKAYRVFNFDNDKWIETHDKNLLNPVDSAELLNFARIEAEEYRDTAKSNGQITDSQEADMWARRFHEKLVYIQARNFSDLSICPCKKVEDFEPDKDDISNPVVNVSEYNIILNNENIIALNLEKSENYTYELFVKFGKDTKITEYKIVQKDIISGNIIKENVENELKNIQKEIWDLSKSYVEQYLHYSIDNDFDITCDYAFSETRKYSNNGNEESLTVYEEPRWSFKNNEDILQIVKNADENFYDELQNIIKSHPGKIFAFDLGKEIVYSEAKNGDENDLSDETLKEKLDNEFVFRYWNVYGDDEINNFEDYGEHIFIKDQTVVDKLNKMIENHVNNNIERYKDFINYRSKRLPELLKKELWEHGEPSLTVDGDGNCTKRFQTFTIEDELQNLLGLANFTYGNNPVKYALFADYELNSEGGIKNEPQIKLWEYYDYNDEEIHTKDSGKALENNFFITPSCLKLIEDTFDLVACENTQETFYSRDYYKMSQVFEGMNIAFGDKSNIPSKDTFAYNFHYICREFKQKDIPETLEEHNDVLFTTITHLIMDNFDFGKLDYNNFDEQFNIEGVDYRWDICDKTANALLKGKIVSTKHIQDFIYDEGDKIMNELGNSGKYNNLTALNDIQEKGFTLILEKYENDEYGKEIAEEIKNYKYPEKEKLVDNVFSMLKEHYKNGEYLVTMETSNDDEHTIELKYSPSELEVLIKARDAFKYGTESLSFVRPNAEQIEDGINNYLTFDEITKGYLLCGTLEDRLINDRRLRNITNIEKANAMFVFESDEDAARQYEKDNKTGLLKEKRDIWIGDDDISSYSIPDTPENRKALKNYILDKPLLEKFNFEEFKEADFNRMKSDLLNHHYIDFMYGSIHLGSISIDFQQREDGIIDVDPYILGEKGIGGEIDLNNSDDTIPYSENALCQFSLKEIENLNYDDFKNWIKDFLIEKIEKDSDSKHLLKEARRITVDWNNNDQCKALYSTKLGEELVEVMARNPLSMNETDKKDAEELLLKGADPKEALLFAAADANLLENCHWLLNHLPYGNAGIFQDKNFADSIYEISKESVTLDEESWQDVCEIGYHGFEEIAKLCGRLDEAEKYYKQLKEKHPELSDVEGNSWENLEKQFKDEKITPVRGDFASIKKDVIDSMRSKDMYDYKEHQKEVVCRILCDVMDFGPLNESVEEEGGLENHSVHSERNKFRWNVVENIAEKIVNGKIAVKEYQKEADKIISDIVDTDLTNKTNIQGEITMNENESIENIEKKLDLSLLEFIKKLDELRINSDKDNNYSTLVVDIPRSELKKTELFKDDTNYPLPGNGLRLIIQNDSFGFKIDIGTVKYQYDISIYKYTQDGKSSRASSPLSENVPSVNEDFGISILGHSDKDKLNNKFFFYANKDIIIEKTVEACRQKQEKIRLEKEKKEAEEQSYENTINSLAEELGITDSNKSPDVSFNSFINDIDKMRDFDNMEKKDFLSFYSYLSEEEYDNTRQELLNIGRSGKEQAEYLENQLDYESLLHEVFDSTIETLDPIIDKIKLWHPEDYGFPKNEKTHLLVEFHNNEEFVGKTFTETEIENIFLNSNVKFEGKNIDVIVLDSKTKSISQFLKNADISKQFRKDFGLNDFGPAANDLDEIYYEIKAANPDSSFNELFEEAVFRKIEETFDMHGFESLLGGREPELDSTLNSDVMTEHAKLLEKVAEEYADGKLLYDNIQDRIDGLLEENKLFQKLVGEGRLPEINNFNLGIKEEPELDKYPGFLGFSIGHNDANGSDYINFSVRFDKENTSLRKLKGFDENAETQKWDRINILYYLDWPDTPSEISLQGKNSYLVLDEYSALTKDLSFNDKQKIRRSAQSFVENYLENQYKGLNLEQAFFTEPAPEPGFVINNSTDLCTVMNNHNKSSSSEPNIDTETAAAILNYLNFRDWKVYKAKDDVYVLDVSEDYDREGHKSTNGDILDLAHDAAYIAKEDGTGYYDKDSYKLVMNAWKEYKQWNKEQHKIPEHENTDTVSPTDEIGQIAKESLLQDVPVLFKKEIIKKLHKDEYKNNPFAAAGSVIKEWKKDCPEYIPILDKYMIDNGFIEKKGYEKFFKDIVGLKKKQPEKSMENKQKKKLSSKDDDFGRS